MYLAAGILKEEPAIQVGETFVLQLRLVMRDVTSTVPIFIDSGMLSVSGEERPARTQHYGA